MGGEGRFLLILGVRGVDRTTTGPGTGRKVVSANLRGQEIVA